MSRVENEDGVAMETRQRTKEHLQEMKSEMEEIQQELSTIYTKIDEDINKYDERQVLDIQIDLKQIWSRYEQLNCNVIKLCESDPMSVEALRTEHFRRSETKNRYDKIVSKQLILHDTRCESTNRSTSARSRISRKSASSKASLKSKAKSAKYSLDRARFELKLAAKKAEMDYMTAKLAINDKMAIAQQQIDQVDIDMLELDDSEFDIDNDDASIKSIAVKSNKTDKIKPIINNSDYSDDDNESILSGMPDLEISGTSKIHSTKHDNNTARAVVSTPKTDQSIQTLAIKEALLAVQRLSMAQELPTPQIKTFSGDSTEYPRFIARFRELVLNKPLDETQKFSRLLQFVTGPALQSIEGLETSGKDKLEKALERLKNRFGHSYKIVHSLIKSITEGSKLRANDPAVMREFADRVMNTRETLQNMGYINKLTEDHLAEIKARLPKHLQRKWSELVFRVRPTREPSIDDMVQLLDREAQVLNDPVFGVVNESTKDTTMKPIEKTKITKATTMKANIQGNNKYPCKVCDGDHPVWKCQTFKSLALDEKWATAKEKRLCFRCLNGGHQASDCKSDLICGIDNCKIKHSRLLHNSNRHAKVNAVEEHLSTTAQRSHDEQNEIEAGQASVNQNHSKSDGDAKSRESPLLQVLPILVQHKGKVVNTYALLDSGSDTTLCEESLLADLDITGENDSLEICTVGNKRSKLKSMKTNLTVAQINGTNKIEIETVWTVKELNISCKGLKEFQLKNYEYLKGIEIPKIKSNEVKILIGTNCPEALIAIDYRKGLPGDPWAVRTKLGWSLLGPARSIGQHRETKAVTVNVISTQRENSLDQQVQKFWELDSWGTTENINEICNSVEDRRALLKMEQSIQLVDGNYQLGLPWRNSEINLPNNKVQAEMRLNSLKRRLLKDESLKQKYVEVIEGYLTKGYARKMTSSELNEVENGKIWYLPHHAVVNPNKSKVRVVFDAAATHKGTSLNNNLLQGPDLTNLLIGVLTRFRTGPVAFCADIEAMFLRVKVPPDDCNALRFFWWPEGKVELQPHVYQMTRHIFGATSSPSCANFALRKTATDNANEFDDEVVQSVLSNFYVDDCLKAVASAEDGLKLSEDLVNLLAKGGFKLTKWCSNNKSVLKGIPSQERAEPTLDLEFEPLPINRALGVKWDPEEDNFIFKTLQLDKPLTKRGILSFVSSLYDPLGFVAPVSLKAKLLVQELWRTKVDWDQPIDEEIAKQWQQWRTELPSLENLKSPRNVINQNICERLELHSFTDASQHGYGCVSYLRQVNQDGSFSCSFLMGKSRLASLKPMTIPRLELQAALVGARVATTLLKELHLDIDEVYFWCDSTIVLSFIKNEARRFKTFVSNRVQEIHNLSEPHQWRYVDTKNNPADDVSRGLSPADICTNSRWIKGPPFLLEKEEFWPTSTISPIFSNDSLDNIENELKTVANVAMTTIGEESPVAQLINYSSEWQKKKLMIAWFLRFKSYLRWKTKGISTLPRIGDIEIDELDTAENYIVKFVQGTSFSEDISILKKERTLKIQSPLLKLAPFMIDDLLKVGGRLTNAPISEASKHPIILPKENAVTNTIIRYYHKQSGHAGVEHVLSEIRKKFWVINGKATVKKVIRNCFDCRKRERALVTQRMGDLPTNRVTPFQSAFACTGLDYFGPFKIKQGRSQVKRYGCLFTCLSTRAVHIEVAHSLDTDSFILALRRFINRRGNPTEIRSDNGTNFTSAEKELKLCIEQLDQSKVSKMLREQQTKWIFNPPTASHMGGVWERLIRSIRRILKGIISDGYLDDESFRTVMVEVEGIMNSRPLTTNSDDPNDDSVITPNNLLLQTQSFILPPGMFENESRSRKRWHRAQYLIEEFWKKWLKSYLPLLQCRQKWLKKEVNLKEGDIVLIADHNVPRIQWPLGRIMKTFPGKDNCVRTVELKSNGTVLKRPVAKLCLLEES